MPGRESEGDSEEEGGEVVRATGLTAGVAVLFLLLRLLAVSDWNWDTASEVLETMNVDDSISIMFGTLFAVPVVAGILVAILLPLAVVDLYRLRADLKGNLGKAVLAILLAVTAVALFKTFAYWWIPAGILAVCGVIAVHELLKRKGKGRDLVLVAVKGVGTAALVALLVMAAVVRTPWTPEERIATKSGEVIGYVLEVEPGYLKVLTSGSREVTIVLTSEVESRAPLE